MKLFFGVSALVIGIGCLCWLLYRGGLLVLNTKTALLYVGSPRWGSRRQEIKATFSACNGTIRRVICLPKDRRFQFVFSAQTGKGDVWVELRGKRKEAAVRLDSAAPRAVISTAQTRRYRVATVFVHADGQYSFSWSEV